MSSPDPRLQLLIVGLDGATFDNLKPWIEQGHLPTFRRLLQDGVHGRLRSTIPPVTAPSWSAFMTGKNPGKHGLYHFVEPEPQGYGLRYTNASSRSARTVWDLLGEAGLRVGVVNVPMTYPPQPVNGFLISGMDAPEGSTAITQPPELYHELAEHFAPVGFQIRYLGYLKTDERRDELLRSLAAMDEHYTGMTGWLLDRYPVDAAMVVFTSPDTSQHFFFHYSDPHHPQHDAPGSRRYGSAILDVYRRLDAAIAGLEARLAPGGSLVLMSDHGFRSTSGRLVHLNRYLEEIGLLRRHPARRRWYDLLRPLLRRFDAFVRGSLGPKQKARIAALFPHLRRRWESQYGGLGDIDWSQTKAYAYEMLTTPPAIWINRKGRRPQGIVGDGAEYDQLLRTITDKLYDLKDPVTGEKLITAVYRREEIYRGPHTEQAPDLTINWWDGIGFLTKPGFGAGDVIEYTGGQPVAGGDWGGTHAADGILVLHGDAFKAGEELRGADILDVVPTLLHRLGQAVPEDMDGRVLLEAFRPEFAAAHPVRSRAADADRKGGGSSYTGDEADKMEERLRGLGYIS